MLKSPFGIENGEQPKEKVKKDTSGLNIEKNKKIALQILLYCSMPSTSRHHWGTDIDIHHYNGNSYFSEERD